MNDLYLVYVFKRHYLVPKNILDINSDLDDVRAYIIFDYAVAKIVSEKVKILSGPLKDEEIVRDSFYADEDYFVIIKNKLINYPESLALDLLKKKRQTKLENVKNNYYMVMYGNFMKVSNPQVISIIQECIIKNIKKESPKVVQITEINGVKNYVKTKKA